MNDIIKPTQPTVPTLPVAPVSTPTPPQPPVETVHKTLEWSRKKIKLAFSILGGVIIVLIIGLGYFFYQSNHASPDDKAKQQLADTITAVGKLIVLPTGETPTMATVSDPAKLQDQPFFAHASVGDIVLVYTHIGKAILYSPKLNKIVEVAPVNLSAGQQPQAPVAPTPAPTTKK